MGHSRSKIGGQFLLESLFVGVLGGAIGAVSGWAWSYVVSAFAGWVVVIAYGDIPIWMGLALLRVRGRRPLPVDQSGTTRAPGDTAPGLRAQRHCPAPADPENPRATSRCGTSRARTARAEEAEEAEELPALLLPAPVVPGPVLPAPVLPTLAVPPPPAAPVLPGPVEPVPVPAVLDVPVLPAPAVPDPVLPVPEFPEPEVPPHRSDWNRAAHESFHRPNGTRRPPRSTRWPGPPPRSEQR